MPREQKPSHGVTLLETLIAIVLLAVTLLSVLATMAPAGKKERQAHLRTAAYDLVRTELEKLSYSVIRDVPSGERARFWDGRFPAPSTPFKSGTVTVGRDEFRFEIFAQTIQDSGGAVLGGVGNRLKQVEVVVRWSVDGVGRGRGEIRELVVMGEPDE